MPTYVYKCSKCQGEFDVVQRMTDARPTRGRSRQAIGGTWGGGVRGLSPPGGGGGFVLNGGGWARDGY